MRRQFGSLFSLVAFALLATVFSPVPRARASAPSTRPTADWNSFQQTVQPFFAGYCLDCHDETKKGDIRLDQFNDEQSLAAGLTAIDDAAHALRRHVMPPKKGHQPPEEQSQQVLAWIDSYIARMDREIPADPGRVVVRRLNRAEYNNTVRDLLGVAFHPADDFPQDDSGYGFDNIGAALSVSPTLMEKYLAAAEKVARAAVYGVEAMKPERVAHEPYCPADAFSRNIKIPAEYDLTGMSLPSAIHVTQHFAATGEYKFHTIFRGSRPAGANPVNLGFWIDGKLVHETKVAPVRGGEMNGQWAEVRLPVQAGDHWLAVTMLRAFEGLPKAYNGPNPSSAAGNARIGVDASFPMYLDVIGPYEQAMGPTNESRNKIFVCGHEAGQHDESCAAKILSNLAFHAYRRPVADHELQELLKTVAFVQHDGDSFEEGLCLAIEKVLISPHFLFRIEKRPEGAANTNVHQLSDFELASRLSYFLWSSMPDDELLQAANEGRLTDPAVLEAQTRRMLKDPRAYALVDNFGGQWLLTRALESHAADRARFPEFTDYTRMSMKLETDLFFHHIVADDRSILDFLDGRYSFLNQRLAEFYGIPGVSGHEFRKVDLAGTRRGGVFTHGSVLTVSSYANRTSPVLRGKWILENLLNAPPPPPPPDVPNLDEAGVGKSVSLREQLEKHRANATCSACHARMDPLGFALEHFDAIGRWRDADGKFDIDSSGTLPDGRSFKNHEELAAILKSDRDAFAHSFSEKLLTYALGRGLEAYDRPTIRQISQKAAAGEYRFSSVVLGIVNSVPFRMQKESRAWR